MRGRDVILGILNRSPRTGYEINDILKNQLTYFYDGTMGMIYPTLRKLEAEGKIKKETIIQDGKPNKNVYTITSSGKQEFNDYMQSKVSPESIKSDFLLRLYFGESILSDDQVIKLIDQEITRKQQQLNSIKDNADRWKEKGMQRLQNITLSYGINYYQSALKFLQHIRSQL
ncbi:PadR family transcriptional regulator [Ligilactobacillus sp. LYQ112]|uniref:PadR family transcriptional regulator n=1 Tax=Ligilactobacillus sp. LYQ112 TaxID=3391060 RepID=UPI00398390C2